MSAHLLAFWLMLPLFFLECYNEVSSETAEHVGAATEQTAQPTNQWKTQEPLVTDKNWQNVWFTAIKGTGEEAHGHHLLATNDGGFLQIGETGKSRTSARILAVKVDANGSLLWSKEIGKKGHNLGNSSIELDDGYWLVGAENQDTTLIKLDKNTGNILIKNTINLGGSDAIEHLIEQNGKLYAVGYKNAQEPNNTFFTEGEGLIMRFDRTGVLEKTQSLSGHLAQGYRIAAHKGNFIVAGLTPYASDYGVMKIDKNFRTLWAKTYGGTEDDHNFAMDAARDGAIYLSGHTLSGTANWDVFTIKLDQNGTELSAQTTGNPRGFSPRCIHDEAWDLKVLPSGEVLVIAGTGDEYRSYSAKQNGEVSDIWRALLIKYASNGELLSQSTFGPSDNETDWAGEALALAKNGDVVLGIDNGSFGFLRLRATK